MHSKVFWWAMVLLICRSGKKQIIWIGCRVLVKFQQSSWNILNRIFSVFLNNLLSVIWHFGVLAQNKHNYCTKDLVLIAPQSIHLNLQVLAKYCDGDITSIALNFCKFSFSIHHCNFLNIILWGIMIFSNLFLILSLIWGRLIEDCLK